MNAHGFRPPPGGRLGPMSTSLDYSLCTLHAIQVAMDEFVRSRGWHHPESPKPQAPRNLAASIALEAAEVLECFQWAETGDPADVGAELADVVLYAAQLANVMGLDLSVAISEKLRLNETRFPAVAGEQWSTQGS